MLFFHRQFYLGNQAILGIIFNYPRIIAYLYGKRWWKEKEWNIFELISEQEEDYVQSIDGDGIMWSHLLGNRFTTRWVDDI